MLLLSQQPSYVMKMETKLYVCRMWYQNIQRRVQWNGWMQKTLCSCSILVGAPGSQKYVCSNGEQLP